MKPIVVVKQSDGTIVLSEEELQNIINDAYLCGYNDGEKEIAPKLYEWLFNRLFHTDTAEPEKKHQTLHS